MVAFAIDPYVLRRIGFGLSDVIELILRTSDSYLSHLSPAWPSGSIPADGEDTQLDTTTLLRKRKCLLPRERRNCASLTLQNRAAIQTKPRWHWGGLAVSRRACA